jgi:hypothetical protein
MRSSTRWLRRRSALAIAAFTGVAVATGTAVVFVAAIGTAVVDVLMMCLGCGAAAGDFLELTFNDVSFKVRPPRN